MSTADTIYALVKTLPEDQADLILVFTEFVCQRSQGDPNSANRSLTAYFGLLKNSPSFNEDPVIVQNKLRHDWD
jgi:hypothetical protein